MAARLLGQHIFCSHMSAGDLPVQGPYLKMDRLDDFSVYTGVSVSHGS
jgi:hypothetical protein